MQWLMTRLRLRPSRRQAALPRWMRRSLSVLAMVALTAGYLALVAHASRSGWVDARLGEVSAWWNRQVADAGFRVASITAYGHEKTEAAALKAALGIEPGAPLLELDLDTLRARVEALPWVRAATVERALPDRLIVRVLERQPAALLQNHGKLTLIDTTGAVIPGTMLSPYAELPTVTGDDAARAAPELLELLNTAPGLAARVTGATFLGGRRWDVRIDDRVWVRLPEKQAEAAWLRLAGLEDEHGVLRRNIQAIDTRNPRQWAFRLPPGMRLRMAIENAGS
jgi:cell division protein FtsQ